MLKALESRYQDTEDRLASAGAPSQQLPACTLADSEFDVASSSTTSCADSGRGLSCEVPPDEPATRVATTSTTVPSAAGRGTAEPSGRSLPPSGRETEPPGRCSDASGRYPELLRGRVTQPPSGRSFESFGRGTDPLGRSLEPVGLGLRSTRGNNLLVSAGDPLTAHSAALDSCRHTSQHPPQFRPAVNSFGNPGKAGVTTTIRFRVVCDSTAVRLQFYLATTFRRPTSRL